MQVVQAQASERTKVLLVDDQLTQIHFERMLLGKDQFSYLVARNGHEAIEQAVAEKPDVILLDIMMPEMDGIEAIRGLRSHPESAHIPVIMVTTRGEERYVERAFEEGCNDYIMKPIDRMELLTKIQALVGR